MPRRAEIALVACLSALTVLPGCFDSHETASTTSANPGAPCGAGDDCVGGTECVSSDFFPGGYCAVECTRGCLPGTLCDPAYGGRLCLLECDADVECRSEYHCFGDVCRPPCRGDWDCGVVGATCTAGRCAAPECATGPDCPGTMTCVAGRCVSPPRDAGVELPVGFPCLAGGECASGVCLPSELGGTCADACRTRRSCAFSQPCSPTLVDFDGDGTADLVTGACIEGDPDGRFLAGSCTTGADCESRSCIDAQCAELCETGELDCLPGQACVFLEHPDLPGQQFAGCGYFPRTGRTDIQDYDLGRHSLSTGGAGTRVSFAIPSDAISVTLFARNAGGEAVPIAYRHLFAPDDTSLFDLEELASFADQPIRWLPINNDEAATISVPSSTPDRVRVLPGRYGVGLIRLDHTSATAEVDLTMRVKRAPSVGPGTLPLDIYLTGVGFDATAAPTQPRLTDALDNLRAIWSAAGITLGEVRFHDVPATAAGPLAIVDSIDGPESELAQLFRLSADTDRDAVSVFLVRSIDASTDGGIILGIAGGIPGPPGQHGTMHSGVAISFDSGVVGAGDRGSRNVAQIMAHEVGHYLGLYHVRERLPPCAAGTGPTDARPCAPFGGEDVLIDTSRGDGENLMWWSLGGDTGRRYNVELSRGQASVLLRSPVVGP